MAYKRLISIPITHSLRVQVTLGVVIPLVVILGAFTIIEYSRLRASILDNLSILAAHSGQVVEASLRQAMMDDNFAEVQSLLDAIGSSGRFGAVYLLDTRGKIIFAPFDEDVSKQLSNQEADCKPCHSLASGERPDSVIVTAASGDLVFRSMHPIENRAECTECHEQSERLLGMLLTDIPFSPMDEALQRDLQENIIWWITTILITVIVVNLVLSRFVLQRLENIANALQGLGSGNTYPEIPDGRVDEIGQLGKTFNMMAKQVETRELENNDLSYRLEQQSALRGELLKRLIDSQENERKRIAREIHDDLGQSLTGLSLQTKVLERFLSTDDKVVHGQLKSMQDLIEDTTDHMYDIILDLRPSVLDDLGLSAAVRTLADRVLTGTNIMFEFDDSNLIRRPPPVIETTLYRIIQEAVNNILRHSNATKVSIVLSLEDGIACGTITDNGQGFVPDSIRTNGHHAGGMGLLGIQERVSQCNGRLEIHSQPGHGTRIHVRIPMTGEVLSD